MTTLNTFSVNTKGAAERLAPARKRKAKSRPLFSGSVLNIATFVSLAAIWLFFSLPGTPAKAETPSPWFHLESVASPSHLHSGEARDEVQELAATPGVLAGSRGLFIDLSAGGKTVGLFTTEEIHTRFGHTEASAQNIEKALEGEEFYGPGNVTVTEEPPAPTSPAGSKSFVITVDKQAAVTALQATNIGGEDGGSAEAKVTTKGRPDGQIVVTAANLGEVSANAQEAPIEIVDRLPPGLEAKSATGSSLSGGSTHGAVQCTVESAREVRCTFAGTYEENHSVGGEEGSPEIIPDTIPPYDTIEASIAVDLQPGATSGELNEASISGGGAPPALVNQPIAVAEQAGEPTPFGVEHYEQTFEEPGGAPTTQAGKHPFQYTTTLNLNQSAEAEPAALPKDLTFKLPAGVVGNPTAYPRCPLKVFANEHAVCPPDTAIGVAIVDINRGAGGTPVSYSAPIFNLEPSVGEPARFAFRPLVPVYLDTSVRTGEDYGVTVRVANITQTVGFTGSTVTFWGDPGDRRHENLRGEACLFNAQAAPFFASLTPCVPEVESEPKPFVTLPTSCTGPLQGSVEADSWAQPDSEATASSEPRQAPLEGSMSALDGCGGLPFSAQIKVAADEQTGSTPSGLKVDVHVPQEQALNPKGLAPADLKNITVTLPEGLILNPSAADGLGACTGDPADQPGSPGNEIGFTSMTELNATYESGVKTAQFADREPSCPSASKIATATITTPLLPNPLTGFVYLAAPQNFGTLKGFPQENPFSALVAMYLVARDKVSGTLVILPGSVALNEATGQITATFANTPQAPFEDAEIEFFGGERAPLATPARCGSYTTNASFEPWTNTATIHEALPATSTFEIASGPNGAPCPGPALPFSPALASGTTSNNAGSFSNLTTTLSRPSGDQNIQSVTLHYPPGLSGLLSGVKLCGEAQANAGTCGPESQIGETIVSVGVGGEPFTVTGGKVYITGPYNGSGPCTPGESGCAPFGLSIVNPAKAGPFDLQEGNPVVVRAKIEISPYTAALTITTNTGQEGHAIPTFIEGFALQIQHVNVLVNGGPDHPGAFTFNPTSCNPAKVNGELTSAKESPTSPSVTSPLEVPFQVTNCAALKFNPSIAFSTNGKTSKSNGANLITKVTYPQGPEAGGGLGGIGSNANLSYVKVELPKALPSRLTTLQKACTDAQFEQNPAACPAASKIGYATVHTPLLPVPLTGPAIFVSHGGEAFPSLTMVLQGYGVTIDLVGTTFISKSGITSTTFKTVPDQPFSSIE
jgi:hypothetical protein